MNIIKQLAITTLIAASLCLPVIAKELIPMMIVTGEGEGSTLRTIAMVPHCKTPEEMRQMFITSNLEIEDNQKIFCGDLLMLDGEHFNASVI